MASFQALLGQALSIMANSSQDSPATVKALACLRTPVTDVFRLLLGAAEAAALEPRLRDLLHVAGWLYPCFMPSSSLAPDVQSNAADTWICCIALAEQILKHNPPTNMTAFQSLVESHRRPRVRGVLVWVDDMAAQLAEQTGRPSTIPSYPLLVANLLRTWHHLACMWGQRADTPPSALMVVQPGVLRLVQRLALQPLPACLHPQVLLSCLPVIANCAGAVVDLDWHPAAKPFAARMYIHSSGSSSSRDSSSSSSRGTTTAASSSSLRGPSAKQLSLVTGEDAFWWGGVAALARGSRATSGVGKSRCIRSAASTPTNITTTSSSRSNKNLAATLCPNYHKGVVWPALAGPTKDDVLVRAGTHCLEVLLLREAQGSLPWALQQLAPFRAAQQAGSTSETKHKWPVLVQWPMTLHQLDGSNSNSTNTATNTPTNISSSSSSRGRQCQCDQPACHLCTPPPPVTLQQLRLVLEVVCLTCQDSTTQKRETASQAQQAPLLLALLLQRASPTVRAAFLNSADGARLLVALQQMAATAQANVLLTLVGTNLAWRFYNNAGALSLAAGLSGGEGVSYRELQQLTQALCSLAWCFFELDPVAAAAGLPHAAAAPSPAVAEPAATGSPGAALGPFLTDAAVAHGCVLAPTTWNFEACIHMLQVPATSLRLAAGVRPSLALFATLECWLRRTHWNDLPMLLAALLAAVRALLEPETQCRCNDIQQHEPDSCASRLGAGATQPSNTGTDTAETARTSTNLNSSGIATTGNLSSSSSSSSSSSNSMVIGASHNHGALPPGVLEAVASAAVTVSKVLLDNADKPSRDWATFAEMHSHREAAVLGAHLSNAVLQLALQQVDCQQQQQQQGYPGTATMYLVEAAQRLARQAAAAAVVDLARQERCELRASAVSWVGDAQSRTRAAAAHERAAAALDKRARAQHLEESSRLMFGLLTTASTRLHALQHGADCGYCATAAMEGEAEIAVHALSAAGTSADASNTAVGAAAPAGACEAQAIPPFLSRTPGASQEVPAVAAADGNGAGASQAQGTMAATWCPTHSSSMEPGDMEEAMCCTAETVTGRLDELNLFLDHIAAVRVPLLGCGYSACSNRAGPSEAGLVANSRGVLCQGCGVVRYCSRACARRAWPTHRKVCGRLAAALPGRPGERSSSSGSRGSSDDTAPVTYLGLDKDRCVSM